MSRTWSQFSLYELAEVFGRANGFNRGLGGSMHAFFPPFGILPNNAIVGGSADIAMGAALFKKCNRKSGIVISNVGDASMGCGPTWEAMNFASMRQFSELWEDSMKGGLPIIFNFMNNFYGMGRPQEKRWHLIICLGRCRCEPGLDMPNGWMVTILLQWSMPSVGKRNYLSREMGRFCSKPSLTVILVTTIRCILLSGKRGNRGPAGN